MLEELKPWPVFTMRDVEKRVKSKAYAKLLIHNKLKKKEITKMGKGVYSFHSDPTLAVFAFKPAYLGLEYALSFYEVWEQQAIPIIITSRKMRIGVREVAGENILVRRTNPQMMFGYTLQEYYGFHIPISDPEKTVVDFAYFSEPIPTNALNALLEKSDATKLSDYFQQAGMRGLAAKTRKGSLVQSMKTVAQARRARTPAQVMCPKAHNI